LHKFGITALSIGKEARSTKKGNGHLPHTPGATEARSDSSAGGIGPIPGKIDKKYLRMIFWASLSTVFLVAGSVACGLLAQEENPTSAVLLFLAALAGAAGCILFFYFFLRELSPKPKAPFISTLH
jgi:hypothetical protein